MWGREGELGSLGGLGDDGEKVMRRQRVERGLPCLSRVETCIASCIDIVISGSPINAVLSARLVSVTGYV
jgi:hypothetical protein